MGMEIRFEVAGPSMLRGRDAHLDDDEHSHYGPLQGLSIQFPSAAKMKLK